MRTNAKTSRLDKEWTTDEVNTLIHHYLLEQCLCDITHSDYSKKDFAKRHWLKSKEKNLCSGC